VPPPRFAILSSVIALCGCDLLIAADDYAVGVPHGCGDNETLVDGACVRVGPSCVGPALQTDDERTCVPVAANSHCTDGEFALVGESSCQRIAFDPCPTDDDPSAFGSSFPGATFVWPDAAVGGDGSADAPFQRIADALAAASDDSTIVLAAGSYAEQVLLQQRVTLHGVCPERVSLDGGVVIEASASGSVVRGLSVSSATEAVLVRGADGVSLQQLWLKSSGRAGVVAERMRGSSGAARSLLVERTLVDNATGSGIRAGGYQLTVRDTHVRYVAELAERYALGRGIWVTPGRFVDDRGVSASGGLRISRSLVEGCHDAGVMLEGVSGSFDGVIIRDIRGSSMARELGLGPRGHGISVEAELARDIEVPSSITIRNSLVDGAHDAGIRIRGASATIRESVVRRTLSASGACAGHGLRVLSDGARSANLDVRSSLIEANEQSGMQLVGANATITDSIVRLTSAGICRSDRSDPTSSDFGDGIGVYSAPIGEDDAPTPAAAVIVRTRIDGNSRHGALAYGEAMIELTQSLLHDNGAGVGHLQRARFHPFDSSQAGAPRFTFADPQQCVHVDRRLFDCGPLADQLAMLAPALYARDDSGRRVAALPISFSGAERTSFGPYGHDELAVGVIGGSGRTQLRTLPADQSLLLATSAPGSIGTLQASKTPTSGAERAEPTARFELAPIVRAFASLTGRALDFDQGLVLVVATDGEGAALTSGIDVASDVGTVAYFDGDALQNAPTGEPRALIAELPTGPSSVRVTAAGRTCRPRLDGPSDKQRATVALIGRLPALLQLVCE
jgi:hypothetical protein